MDTISILMHNLFLFIQFQSVHRYFIQLCILFDWCHGFLLSLESFLKFWCTSFPYTCVFVNYKLRWSDCFFYMCCFMFSVECIPSSGFSEYSSYMLMACLCQDCLFPWSLLPSAHDVLHLISELQVSSYVDTMNHWCTAFFLFVHISSQVLKYLV